MILTVILRALLWKYPAAAILLPVFLFYEAACLGIYIFLKKKKKGRRVAEYAHQIRVYKCRCLILTAATDVFGLAAGEDTYFLFDVLCCADGIAMARDLINRIKVTVVLVKDTGIENAALVTESPQNRIWRDLLIFRNPGASITLYIIIGAFVPFLFQPSVSDSTVEDFDISDYYSDELSGERAMVISDNGEALEERIRLISQARERIILSTFEIDADSTGMMVMAALMEAAERGVEVCLLADGFPYLTEMWGNPYFLALATTENVEIRIYNSIRPWKPWTFMGRLHDKYLIVDDMGYILGGRNTFNYFLGDQEGHRNYDWDVLVYSAEAGEDNSLERLEMICDEVEEVIMMTNSVANNGNPFGTSDYARNKEAILETGVQILEYDGGISYHGKCFVIDDRLSGVGSFNWDMRSVYIDTELMLMVDSEDFAALLREEMQKYEKASLFVIDADTSIVPEGMEAQELSEVRRVFYSLLDVFSWARFIT